MRNLDHKEDPMDRADQVCRAYEGINDLLCGKADLHLVGPENLYPLLDILNRELALSLRDAFAQVREIRSREARRELAAAGALVGSNALPRKAE